MKTNNTFAVVTLCILVIITITQPRKEHNNPQLNIPIPTIHELYDFTITPANVVIDTLC